MARDLVPSDSIDADMNDGGLAAGLEDELATIRPSGEGDDETEDPDDEVDAGADDPDEVEDPDEVDDPDEIDDEDDELDDDDDPADPAAPADAAAAPDAAATDAAPITREDGATFNTTAKRWQKDGKFVEGDPPAAPVATDAAKPAEPTPGWEPFKVTVDREAVAIPEAQIGKNAGHMIVAIPEAKWPDFQSRIVKGVAAERSWRQLRDGIKQLEDERKAQAERPAIRSDAEVEADVLLEVLKPHMKELLTDEQLENVAMRVKLAQGEEQKKLGTWETERTTKAQAAAKEHEAMIEQIAEAIIETVDTPEGVRKPEFAHLTDDDLREAMGDMAKNARGIVTKNGEKYERNTSLVQYVLSNVARAKIPAKEKEKVTAPTDSATASSAATPATPAKAGTTVASADGASGRAEKFNKGVSTAAKPESTNLKARRTAGKGRPSDRSTTGEPRRKNDTRTRAQRDEDRHRKLTRSWTSNTSTLELPDNFGGDDP